VPDEGYTLSRRIQDIKELLDRFPGRPVVLVGWSLAALEAIAYAGELDTGRLVGLVLVDNSIGEGPDRSSSAGENPFFIELRTQRDQALRKFVDAIFRTEASDQLKERVLASALKMKVEDSIRLLSYGKPRAYWRDTLHRQTLPVLYLVTPAWEAQGKLLLSNYSRARMHVFRRAGHALFWDEAKVFNRAVEDFIRRL
jgi:microsomal epoxide hydrolase